MVKIYCGSLRMLGIKICKLHLKSMHDTLMMEIRKEQPFSLIPIDTFGHNLVTVVKNYLSESRILGVYEVVAGREGFKRHKFSILYIL